jgi:hypothetical protein
VVRVAPAEGEDLVDDRPGALSRRHHLLHVPPRAAALRQRG